MSTNIYDIDRYNFGSTPEKKPLRGWMTAMHCECIFSNRLNVCIIFDCGHTFHMCCVQRLQPFSLHLYCIQCNDPISVISQLSWFFVSFMCVDILFWARWATKMSQLPCCVASSPVSAMCDGRSFIPIVHLLQNFTHPPVASWTR